MFCKVLFRQNDLIIRYFVQFKRWIILNCFHLKVPSFTRDSQYFSGQWLYTVLVDKIIVKTFVDYLLKLLFV